MNRLFRDLLAGLIITIPLAPGVSPPAARRASQTGPFRIALQIATIEDTGSQTKVISRSVIEGPPDTDFAVALQGIPITMQSDFLTDLLSSGQLRIRARVKTDRLYGYSEHKLPLYEEAKMTDDLSMGFDEAVQVYPFGQNATDNLRIEITPSRTTNPVYDPAGRPLPLSIKILDVTAANPVRITATRRPHRFNVQANVLEDGVEIATGKADCLLEEPSDIVIAPVAQGSGVEPLTLNFNVEQYGRNRPVDTATVSFSLYRGAGATAKSSPLGQDWVGVASLGSELTYDLSQVYPGASGHKISLRLLINLAPGEMAD
jgi:hypothetical protein